jgi:hypothetical protein
MKRVLRYKTGCGRKAGPRLRCFLNDTLLVFLVIGSSCAKTGYALTCPEPSALNLSHLQGTVYGPSGVAIPQIQVRVERDGKLVSQIQTDDKGRFDFKVEPGNYVVHLQFLGPKSMEMNVRIGHGFRGGFFRAARLRIVLGLSGARCSFATTSAKQFKDEMRRYRDRLVEVPPGP